MATTTDKYTEIVLQDQNFNRPQYINRFWTDSYSVLEPSKNIYTEHNPSLTFNINPCPKGVYIDLSDMKLQIRFSITDEQGEPLNMDPSYYLAPINNFAETCIKSVEVSLNNQVLAGTSHNFYGEYAYIKNAIGSSRACRVGYLESKGYYEEMSQNQQERAWSKGSLSRGMYFGQFDIIEDREAGDPRYGITYNSTEFVTFHVPLKTALNNCQAHLISGVPMKVVVTFHSSKYILHGDDNAIAYSPRFNIGGAELRLIYRRSTEGQTREIEKFLSDEDKVLLYRYKRTQFLPLNIPAGETELFTTLGNLGITPERIIILTSLQKNHLDNISRNPLDYDYTFDAPMEGGQRQFSSIVKSNLSINGVPLDTRSVGNNSNSLALLHFERFYENMDREPYNTGYDLDSLSHGLFHQSFDLTQSMNVPLAGETRLPTKQGSITYQMALDKPCLDTLRVLICLEYNASFTINKNRVVITQMYA